MVIHPLQGAPRGLPEGIFFMRRANQFEREDVYEALRLRGFSEAQAQRRATMWHRPLLAALGMANLTNARRQAHFLAQICHESGGFTWLEEIWGPTPAQLRYEGRRGLGNTQPGDGYRYRGRGLIQLTGRANYRRAGQALELPLEQQPEMAAVPEYAAMIAAWFWSTRRPVYNGQSTTLNALADTDTVAAFRAITRAINGGENGLEDRRRWLELWRRALARGG